MRLKRTAGNFLLTFGLAFFVGVADLGAAVVISLTEITGDQQRIIECELAPSEQLVISDNVDGKNVTASVTNCDVRISEIAVDGFTVNPVSVALQPDTTGTFRVSLDTVPPSPVRVAIRDPAGLVTVEPENFELADTRSQTVSVTAPPQATGTTILELTTTSAYAGGDIPDVQVSVQDTAPACIDPGYGSGDDWSPPASCGFAANLRVVDPIEPIRTYLPNKQNKRSGTIENGEVWAQRVWPTVPLPNIGRAIKLAPSEAGEDDSVRYDIALSTIPGSFTRTTIVENGVEQEIDLPPECLEWNKVQSTNPTILAMDENSHPQSLVGSCRYRVGTLFYLNIRTTAAATQPCGIGLGTCRVKTVDDVTRVLPF